MSLLDGWDTACHRLTSILRRLWCPHSASEPFWLQGRPRRRCEACGASWGVYDAHRPREHR